MPRYTTPLVADIHFQPKVALLVADAFEKIRINPGNFSDGFKSFEETTYDDPAEFAKERDYMRTVSVLILLIRKCDHMCAVSRSIDSQA